MSKYFAKCFGPSHLLEHLSFRLRCPSFILSKFASQINSICGAGQDIRNLCHKFNSQGPALRVLGLRVASPKSQGSSSRVLVVLVLVVPGSWVSGYQSPRVPGPKVLGLRSWF